MSLPEIPSILEDTSYHEERAGSSVSNVSASSGELPNVAEPDRDAQDLFGGPSSNTKNPGSDLALVAEIKKDERSIQKARETVLETIRAQDDQKEELKQADYLLKTLKKVNALVQNVTAHGLRPESAIQGVEMQIKGIRDNLDAIEAWVASKRG